ncbi:nucleoid-associated protein, partial [Pantoea dispersa]
LFEFLDFSNVERILRIISNTADQNPNCFSDESKQLATDFHSHHTGNASKGVFLLFELTTILGKLYALIKYENEDVVRYVLEDDVEVAHVPKLERFSESFV